MPLRQKILAISLSQENIRLVYFVEEINVIM